MAVLGSRFPIVVMVSVEVKQHLKKDTVQPAWWSVTDFCFSISQQQRQWCFFLLLFLFSLSLLKWNRKTAGNWTVVSPIPLLPHPLFPSFFRSVSATFDLLCDEFRSILLLAGRLVRLAERAPPERGRGDHQCG